MNKKLFNQIHKVTFYKLLYAFWQFRKLFLRARHPTMTYGIFANFIFSPKKVMSFGNVLFLTRGDTFLGYMIWICLHIQMISYAFLLPGSHVTISIDIYIPNDHPLDNRYLLIHKKLIYCGIANQPLEV